MSLEKRPYHTACPKCRENGRDKAGNNLYCYEDGHDYCYACGYRKPASTRDRLIQVETKQRPPLALPPNTTNKLGIKAQEWLDKYEITKIEQKDFGLLWSDRLQWLFFPVYANELEETLLGYQARNFSDLGPKYYTMGSWNTIVNYYDQKNTKEPKRGIILVEDMISAIKVSRQYTAMPLFSSHLSEERGKKLRNFFDTLYFWLDYDKALHSMSLASAFKQHGFQTHVIVSTKDPKEYNDAEIRSIITNDFEADAFPDVPL